ncbi:MAG TPA: thermonuclease family protein [Phycisphaerae bacterium]
MSILTATESRRGLHVRLAVVILLFVGSGAWLARTLLKTDSAPAVARMNNVKVKRVLSGHTVEIKHGDRLTYAAIRAPYGSEPLFEDARRRNAELVEGKELRLRYDHRDRLEGDEKNRLVAYAFIDGQMINERLVREGWAYVRLTPDFRRFAEQLLAAQSAARHDGVGLWSAPAPAPESDYPADPKYGNFHRPSCAEVGRIKPERLTSFKLRDAALDAGFAPCPKCCP